MRIVVCVEGTRIGVSTRSVIAWARRLVGAEEVIAVCAGLPGRTDGLAEALALGAGRALHVADPALDGADVNPIGIAMAAAVKHLEARLVLGGMRSGLEGRGVVPAAIACHLGAAYLARAEALEHDPGNPEGIVVTVRSGGKKRRLSIPLPAVVTVAAVEEPAQATKPETAAEREIEILSAVDLALEPDVLAERPDSLGVFERVKRKPMTVGSADQLIRRWLEK